MFFYHLLYPLVLCFPSTFSLLLSRGIPSYFCLMHFYFFTMLLFSPSPSTLPFIWASASFSRLPVFYPSNFISVFSPPHLLCHISFSLPCLCSTFSHSVLISFPFSVHHAAFLFFISLFSPFCLFISFNSLFFSFCFTACQLACISPLPLAQ